MQFALTTSLDLRRALDQLTTPRANLTAASPAADWDTWLESQVDDLPKIAVDHPHTIKLRDRCSPDICKMNCFLFALRVKPADIEAYVFGQIVFFGSKFMAHLEKSCLATKTRADPNDAQDGDLVIYYRDGKPEHAGTWEAGKVISKWGLGHVWCHPIGEVPASYGGTAAIFRRPQKVTRFYQRWAEDHGVGP